MLQMVEGSKSQKRDDGGCYVPRWALVACAGAAVLLALLVGIITSYLTHCQQSTGTRAEDFRQPKTLPYVRLPTSVVPDHYDVTLRPYLNNFTFDGSVRIRIRVLESTSNVTLHVTNMTVVRDSVRMSGKEVPDIEVDDEREFYVLHMKGGLSAGQEYEVRMDFVGELNDQLVGFYRSSYNGTDGRKRYLATTQFQPTSARRAFPCFDEPAFKATFNITIVRPSNMTSISNMPLDKSIQRDDDWVEDHFQTTVKMSTYLVAFIVSDFKKRGDDKFSVWSRESLYDTTAYAMEIGPKILKFYENFFRVKFPLPKMDMIAVPDFGAGAMENWGLITYRETALLYDTRYSSSGNKARVAEVVAHELAHQWFGNLVTPAWWDDLWLNEGFASYVEYLGVNSVHPDWLMDQQFVLNDVQDVMELDCLKTSHPISIPVYHPDEINEIFDRISYGKGASLIRMMKYFLGEENFRNGLMNYLNAKKYGSSVQDDLWMHLTKVQQLDSDKRIDVKRVMDSWTLQTGYPIITVERDYSKNTATVKQNRFLLEREDNGTQDQSAWEIALTYTDGLNPDWEPKTKLWLHKTNGSISGLPGPNYWIVANIQEVGYYRVNYDLQNWQLLLNQFNQDHKKIHTVNRAQIIDDSLDLARAGLLSYHVALNTTLYLKEEDDYLPWKAALYGFSFLDSMICRTAIYGKWKKYLIEQLKPAYESLGWDDNTEENILRQYKRVSTLVWMCGYGYKDCVNQAKVRFEQWRRDPENLNIIPPNLRNVVYCSAIEYGDADTWDFLWDRYQKTETASEKAKFLSALACTHEPWLLKRYLNWTMVDDSGIRKQDGGSVLRAISSRLYARDLTFNYLRDKWTPMMERYGKAFSALSRVLKTVTSSLNTPFELSQLREFYSKYKTHLGTTKRAFEQSLENAEANVRWMGKNYGQLEDWLNSVV